MFEGKRYHADDNEYKNVREDMSAPLGAAGFVSPENIPEEGSDPLEKLLKEEGKEIDESDDGAEDDSYEEGSRDDLETSPFTKYEEHGVATEEEAEKTSISTSGERAPRTPRIKDWFGLRRDNKTDEERGAAERGKR